MGSIAGTLNSISSSLLSQFNNNFQPKIKSVMDLSSASTVSSSTTATATDTVNFSQLSQLFKDLGQLQTSNPAEFKQLASEAATQLKAAAGETSDTQQAAFLNDLADKFQAAATSGNLSAFQPNASSNATSGLYSAQGHHHHHGAGGGAAAANSHQDQSVTATSAGTTVTT